MASVCVRDRSTVHNFTNLNYGRLREKNEKHTHGIKIKFNILSALPAPAGSPSPLGAGCDARARVEGDRPISTCYVVYHEARADTLAIHVRL